MRGALPCMAGLFLAVLGACGAGLPSTDPAPALVTAAAGGTEIFARVCLGCHDEPDPPRPDFARPLTAELARRAMLAVLGQAMPPQSSDVLAHFTEAGRAALVGWLCKQTSRSDRSCQQIVQFETAPTLARSATTILAILQQDGVAPVSSERARLVKPSLSASGGSSPRAVRDSRLVAVVLLASIDACNTDIARWLSELTPWLQLRSGAPTGGGDPTARSNADRERSRCIERLLGRALARPDQPPQGSPRQENADD
jgi:hypothetical protein